MDEFKSNIAKAFGNALRESRAKRQMSQEMLSFESGVDRTFVSMLERGIRQPALSTVFALAQALSVKPAFLIEQSSRFLDHPKVMSRKR